MKRRKGTYIQTEHSQIDDTHHHRHHIVHKYDVVCSVARHKHSLQCDLPILRQIAAQLLRLEQPSQQLPIGLNI